MHATNYELEPGDGVGDCPVYLTRNRCTSAPYLKTNQRWQPRRSLAATAVGKSMT